MNKKVNIIDGMSWVYNSYKNWHKQLSFISTNTIKKAIKSLEDMEIILCDNFNKCKMDKTKWYTINYDKLKAFLEKHKDSIDKNELSITINDPMKDKNIHCSGLKLAEDVNNSVQTIPETTTELTHSDDNKESEPAGLKPRKAQFSNDEKALNIMLPENNSFKDIVIFYMKNISLPGGYELERLKYLLEEFKDPEFIIFAIEQSLQNNARNLRYIEKVLYNWMDNGVKNKNDAEAFTESNRKHKEEKGYGGFTGNSGKNRFSHPKAATESKWAGYHYLPHLQKKMDKTKLLWKVSGIEKERNRLTFGNYKTYNEASEKAKGAAIAYFENFNSIKSNRRNSIAFLGQVGSGKTHLSVAIGLNLLAKGIPLVYMSYRDEILKLKQNILDEEFYINCLRKYKAASVLIIDDLFKGKINDADINIIFEIINYRYMNNLPIIVSSEFTAERLLYFDEGVGIRIIEMRKDYIVEILRKESNFRIEE